MRQADPGRLPPRVKHNPVRMPESRRAYEASFGVCGGAQGVAAAKTRELQSRPLHRGAPDALAGLSRLVRGRRCRTTIPEESTALPLNRLNRQFAATRANELGGGPSPRWRPWVDFVSVAFVIDVLPGASSAGGQPARCRPSGCSMRRSRSCGLVPASTAQSTPATTAASIGRSVTRSG